MEYLKRLKENIKKESITQEYFSEVYHDQYIIGLKEYLKV